MLLSRTNDDSNKILSAPHGRLRNRLTLSAEEVLEAASRRLQNNPHDVQALKQRSRSLMRLGDYRSAIEDLFILLGLLQTAGAKGTDVAHAFFSRGVCHEKLSLLDEAIVDLTAALDADPAHKRAAYERAACHNRKGNFTAAILDYERALQHDVSRGNYLLYRTTKSRFAKLRTQKKKDVSAARDEGISSSLPRFHTGKSIDQNSSQKVAKNVSNRRSAQKPTQALKADTKRSIDVLPIVHTERTAAVSSEGDAEEVHHQRGLEYRKQGDLVKAIREYTVAIQINPGNFKALFNRGFCRDKIGDYDAAIQDYQSALKLEPGYAYTYYNLGISLDRKGDRFDEAIAMFDKAIALDDSNPDFYHNRGFSRRKMGCYQEAVKDYTRAITLDQRHFKAYYNRAFCYDKLGETNKAVEDYSNAIAIQDDNPNAYHNRGAALEKMGRLTEAVEDYSQAIALDSGNPYIYDARGLARACLSQYDTAIKDMTQAITLSPSNSIFYQNRGSIFQRMERYVEALRDYDAALRLQAQDAATFISSFDDGKREDEVSAAMIQTHSSRGLCNISLERYGAAACDFTEVLNRDATNAFGLLNRGICYSKLSRHSQALADFTKLTELDPKNVDARMNRGAAFEAIGNYVAALEEYSAVVAIDVERSGMNATVDITRLKEEHRATKASQRLLQIIRDQNAIRKR